ncbi:MAG: hypothetical protein M3P18_24775 [Actinomycetota bacterium]|nr:hypothetical protein [Actinomycetota bacterium]
MNPSTNMNKRLTAVLFAVAVTAITLLVPVAQAQPSGKYGQLDPWAYAAIHRSAQANVVSAGKYGTLDPWAYAVIHSVATGQQIGRPTSSPAEITTGLAAPTLVNSSGSSGVNFRDVGIGAVGTFGLMLLAVGMGFAMRKRGTLAHSR